MCKTYRYVYPYTLPFICSAIKLHNVQKLLKPFPVGEVISTILGSGDRRYRPCRGRLKHNDNSDDHTVTSILRRYNNMRRRQSPHPTQYNGLTLDTAAATAASAGCGRVLIRLGLRSVDLTGGRHRSSSCREIELVPPPSSQLPSPTPRHHQRLIDESKFRLDATVKARLCIVLLLYLYPSLYRSLYLSFSLSLTICHSSFLCVSISLYSSTNSSPHPPHHPHRRTPHPSAINICCFLHFIFDSIRRTTSEMRDPLE